METMQRIEKTPSYTNDCFNLRVAACYPCGKQAFFPKGARSLK
jgi:hypothetical protein